jgi:uncharacterized membrane protein HdeD (DUF308 family)
MSRLELKGETKMFFEIFGWFLLIGGLILAVSALVVIIRTRKHIERIFIHSLLAGILAVISGCLAIYRH